MTFPLTQKDLNMNLILLVELRGLYFPKLLFPPLKKEAKVPCSYFSGLVGTWLNVCEGPGTGC